jgi:hypothetical protein
LGELGGGKKTAQRVVDVRVSTRLIQHEVAIAEPSKVVGDIRQKVSRLFGAFPLRSGGNVDNSSRLQSLDDVVGAITIVIVIVEDAYAQVWRPAPALIAWASATARMPYTSCWRMHR